MGLGFGNDLALVLVQLSQGLVQKFLLWLRHVTLGYVGNTRIQKVFLKEQTCVVNERKNKKSLFNDLTWVNKSKHTML